MSFPGPLTQSAPFLSQPQIHPFLTHLPTLRSSRQARYVALVLSGAAASSSTTIPSPLSGSRIIIRLLTITIVMVLLRRGQMDRFMFRRHFTFHYNNNEILWFPVHPGQLLSPIQTFNQERDSTLLSPLQYSLPETFSGVSDNSHLISLTAPPQNRHHPPWNWTTAESVVGHCSTEHYHNLLVWCSRRRGRVSAATNYGRHIKVESKPHLHHFSIRFFRGEFL